MAAKKTITTKKKTTVKKTADPKNKAMSAAVKKTEKMAVKRKNTAKKTTKKVSAKKKISPEQYFYTQQGKVIKDIEELIKYMDKMSDEEFFHHVNESKHDFALWIENVLGELDLAKTLYENKRDKQGVHYVMLRHVFFK